MAKSFLFWNVRFSNFFFNFMMRKVWKEFKNWLKIAKIFSSIIHIFTTMNNFAIFEKAFFTTTVQFSLLVQLRKWWAEKKVLGGLIYMLGRVEHENWISVKVVVFLNALLPAQRARHKLWLYRRVVIFERILCKDLDFRFGFGSF